MARTTGYWFEDAQDPGLARWFDGTRPTEHAVRIAHLPEGTPPPEPLPADRLGPLVGTATGASPEGGARHLRRSRPGDRVPEFLWGAEHPVWQISRSRLLTGCGASALVVVLALVLQLLGGPASSPVPEPLASVGHEVSYSDLEIVDAAQRAVQLAGASGIDAADLQALLPVTCSAAADRAPARIAGRLSLFRFETSSLPAVIRALRTGARALCPDVIQGFTDLFDSISSMVLTVDRAASVSYTNTGGNVVVGGTDSAVTTGSATATGSTGDTTATGAPSTAVGTSSETTVVQVGSSCSAAGAIASSVGGTAICTSATTCTASGDGTRWRLLSC